MQITVKKVINKKASNNTSINIILHSPSFNLKIMLEIRKINIANMNIIKKKNSTKINLLST